ncbi:MAG: membrane protein insertase YidC, partial [Spirochaetaceae bacterium]|nr:membrane protein insertase YidC [Spirochaetaceae bacterium]
MEKNTVLAIVVSSLIIMGWFFLQPILFPRPEQAPGQTGHPATETSPVVPAAGEGAPDGKAGEFGVPADTPASTDISGGSNVPASGGNLESGPETAEDPVSEPEERIVIETDIIQAVLSSAGGDMVSYRLKEHKDKGEMVEMILPTQENGQAKEFHAFTVAFGGLDAQPVNANFRVSKPAPLLVEFSRDFSMRGYPGTFTLVKRYEFKNNEYMFQLTVYISSDSGIPLNFNNAAYTLGFGPQIGPSFQKLDQRYEYRHYYSLANGKRSNVKPNTVQDSRFTWAGIAGKYFAAIVVPDNTLYGLSFSDKPEPGISVTSHMSLIRPAINTASTSDVFHFYLGPKNQENLGRYDTGDNGFKLRDLDFTKAGSTSGILGPLESFLKWLLLLMYKLVHNYGVAIIFLTLLVKILLFPLTKKSSEATIKMQAIAPKIKEVQAKYKDNPAKMNAELGALYKKEGHNPLSGCLPLLIQMPLFFAMYNLFNNHFDLRGAMFIPGWIPDLSLP